MNEITATGNRGVYPQNPVTPQNDGTGVGPVSNGGAAGEVSGTSGTVALNVVEGGSSLPSAERLAMVNILKAPNGTNASLEGVQGKLAAFLESLLVMKDWQEADGVSKSAQLRKIRRLDDKLAKLAEEVLFDTFMMMAIFNTSNGKRDKLNAMSKMLIQMARSANAEAMAKAYLEPKNLAILVTMYVIQGLLAAYNSFTSALSNKKIDSKLINKETGYAIDEAGALTKLTAYVQNSDKLRIGLDTISKALDIIPKILKYYEDGDEADRKMVKQSQAEAVQGMLQVGKEAIEATIQNTYQLCESTNKLFEAILKSDAQVNQAVNV